MASARSGVAKSAFPTRCIYCFVAILMGVASSAGLADLNDAPDGVLAAEVAKLEPSGWRLIWKEDPAHQATISWDTAEKGARHQLHYRLVHEDATAVQACQGNGIYGATNASEEGAAAKAGNGWYHHARLTDLQPDSIYEVQMESDDQRSQWFHFRTAPERDRGFTLLCGGDSRSDPAKRREINHLMQGLLDDSVQSGNEESEILAFLHGGDFIASGNEFQQWNQWARDHQLTTTELGRLLPIVPTRGNHDGGPLFAQMFDFDVDHGNYYATDLGPRLSIVTLNTEYSIAGSQKDWLETTLAKARPGHRWLIAQYHRPAFPAVKWPSGALLHWVPLFDRYAVDLVAESDGHVMKRTVPIRDGEKATEGTVYVGEGGLGVDQRSPKSKRWYLRPPGYAGQGHHVVSLTFAADSMTVRFISETGQIVDEYVVNKS